MIRSLVALAILQLALVVPCVAQSDPFGDRPVTIVSEWQGQDRGDGSGSYQLVTTAASGGVTIEHSLASERDWQGEVTSKESLRVREGGAERAHSGSDPSALGEWSDEAVTWVIPFATDFDGDPHQNYRANDKKARQAILSVVPDAKVSTDAGSDRRGTADVEIPGTLPVDELAQKIVAIRGALEEANMTLAKLRIQGQATRPMAADEATP